MKRAVAMKSARSARQPACRHPPTAAARALAQSTIFTSAERLVGLKMMNSTKATAVRKNTAWMPRSVVRSLHSAGASVSDLSRRLRRRRGAPTH
jgi:hypothetical protein